MLYKKPIPLNRKDSTSEGQVYRIGKNLVKKVWRANAWGKYDLESILNRFKKIREAINTLPVNVKKQLAVPEFVGYEKKGYYIITYHEYIEPTRIALTDIPNEIGNLNYKVFKDMQFNYNTLYSNGKFYLVDVVTYD